MTIPSVDSEDYKGLTIGYFGVILSVLTLALCFFFRSIRTASCFTTGIRKNIANFGVVLSILICVAVDYVVGLNTPKLNVPTKFVTSSNRNWLVNPIPYIFGVKENNQAPTYLLFSIIPALFCTVLMFLDQQITAVIINRQENLFKKPYGYHLDLFVISLLLIICIFLGLPLYVAATVRSIAHVKALQIFDDKNATPGQTPRLLGCIETRLTGTVVFILIGLSIFAGKYLQLIPLNVLYGVFIYMGIMACVDLQVIQRLKLLITPVKHQPDYDYLRKVRLPVIHSYTIIQVFCIIGLYAVKSNKAISILFPVMIIFIVFVRRVMGYVFSKDELEALDH